MKHRGIILLEGADCSGKTTLAKHLVERYGARYLHGRVFKDMWKSHVAMVRLALRWADEDLVVIDRLWLSELVYGQVYRGGPSYDLGARCLDRVLQRAGTVTVLCAPNDQELQKKRHGERASRGEEVYQQVSEVIALYADLRHGNLARPGDGYLGQLIRYGDYPLRSDVRVYDLDLDGYQLGRFGKSLLRQLASLREAQYPPALSSRNQNFTGSSATARSLVIGDSPSPTTVRLSERGPRWPFCWHDGLSAATWLNRALHTFGHDETSTVFTNSYDREGRLSELLELSWQNVVTLGTKAADRVKQLGFSPTSELEHPQHHLRFHHAELADYSRQLARALREV